MRKDWIKAEEFLKKDGVVVLPTDTLYGIIGRALSKKIVKKIYKIKGRTENKPFIVLINSYNDLKIFGIKIDKNEAKFLEKIWPGKVSIIFACNFDKWSYLHRGTHSIAFRMVSQRNKNLFSLIEKVGPLVAPSANPEGKKPAENISEAKKYFKKEELNFNKIDLYINGGKRKVKPSTLIKYKNNTWVILRQGKVKIPQI